MVMTLQKEVADKASAGLCSKHSSGSKLSLKVKQDVLVQALSIVSRAATQRTTLPILANILACTEGGRLKLAATNLEIGISLRVDVSIKGEGAVTLPAKPLTEMVAALPNEEIVLSIEGQDATLKCVGTSAKMKGLPANDFPAIEITR